MNMISKIVVLLMLTYIAATTTYSGEEGKALPCDIGTITINCGTKTQPIFKDILCQHNSPQGKRWKADKDGSAGARKAVYECAKHDGCDALVAEDDGQCGGLAAVGDAASE